MKSKFFILVLIAICTFSACKKNILKGNTTAEVYLRETGSGEPINGGKVYLYGVKLSGGGIVSGGSLTLLETYTTDEDGYVYIDFKHKKDYKDEDYDLFTLRGYAAQYFIDDTEYDLKTKEDNEITIKLAAEAYLKVCIDDVSDEIVRITLTSYGTNGSEGTIGGGTDNIKVGECTSATTYTGWVKLYFGLFKQNDPIDFEHRILVEDSVYCPAHETTEYYFEY